MGQILTVFLTRFNAPLFAGPFTVNRRLLFAIAAVLAGAALDALVSKLRRLPRIDLSPAWAAALLAWKFFPALVHLRAVSADPALAFAWTGGYGAFQAAVVAWSVTVLAGIGIRLRKGGRESVAADARALARNLLLTAACAIPVAILAASLPVPAFPVR